MKILLIGEYYSYNLGDPLLCRTVERVIKNEYPNAEIIPFDMSGKTGYNEFFDFNQRTFVEWGLTKTLDIFSKIFINHPLSKKYRADRLRHLAMLCSLLQTLRKHRFDIAIFAGGSIFMDYFSGIIYLLIHVLHQKKFLSTA